MIGERYQTARKVHACDCCRFPIKPGDYYVMAKTTPSDQIWPGHWSTWREHVPCPENDYEASL